MRNNIELNDLSNLEIFISECSVSGYNWKGNKLLVNQNNVSISFPNLLQKLEKIFHTEFFPGAQLSETDCNKLLKIKNRIEELDKKPIKISYLHSCYLRIVHIAKRILPIGNINTKNILLQEITQRASKPCESILLANTVKSDLSDQVAHALQCSYNHYYKNPFKDSHIRKREAVRSAQGEKIHRYNHGLAHTIRKVFCIPFVIDYLSRHGTHHLSEKLQGLIKEDGLDRFTEKLQLAITFEVAGRESECGSRDNLEVYTSYLDKSAEAFKTYCSDTGLIGADQLFKNDQDVERYAEAIKTKYYNRSKKDQMDIVPAILDISHTLDEFRCYWPSRMKDELESVNHFYTEDKNNRDLWKLAAFCENAVKVTGDRLMSEFSDGFTQRARSFAINDFTSFFFRNFSFTNELAFVNCSQDINYSWKLLKRMTPPISYSRGETTFSYVSRKGAQVFEKPSNSAQEALDIISDGNAAIRLVNSQTEKFGFEMEMLNNPVFFRPTRAVTTKRDWVVSDREGGILYNRGFKERMPLMDQIKNDLSTKQSDSKWQSVYKDRGLPKFTEYTKKLSFCLLRPDAKIRHFEGEFPKEYGRYEPVGFLYDVNQLNQKSQKYIFDKDVGTSSKFWIGANAKKTLNKKIGRETNLNLDQMKAALKKEADKNLNPESLPFYKMQHAANEMLMCPKKSAIRAVFATEDTPQARVRTFMHAVFLKQDYGIHVPTLIIDGKKPAKAYTKSDLEQDLEIMRKEPNCIINDLSSCFFSREDQSKEKLTGTLLDKCTPFIK